MYDGDLAPGSLAGDYVVARQLGRGGCGTVYLGEHRLLRRRVALKVLHGWLAASPTMVERFVREAQAANLIRHPAIVDVHDFGLLADGRPYFVMELLEGESLQAHVARGGRLGAAEVVELLAPVCEALTAAHAAGIIHRDVKSSNIMLVAAHGQEGRRAVKLLDFGIAKLTDPSTPSLTTAGRHVGTPFTMAPEQIRGEAIDGRADLYSLGVVAFQLLTGRYPFMGGAAVEIERQHLAAPPPAPSSLAPVSPAVDEVVLRALEKQPERRFPSVAAFLSALRAAVHGGPRPAATSRRAVALLASVAVGDDPDPDQLAAVLGAAEELLVAASYAVPVATATSVLGVKLLPADPDDDRAARLAAFALARDLRAAGAEIYVHVDDTTAEADGGAILDAASHVAVIRDGAIEASPSALAGLDAPADVRLVTA